jgi:hypothetical protein
VATEVLADSGSAVAASGGTDAPAAGTVQTWTLAGSTLPPVATGISQCWVADPAAPSELMLVTNISGATATVTRGADGSTPVAHVANFTVNQVLGAGMVAGLTGERLPCDIGALAWNRDPGTASSIASPANGVPMLCGIVLRSACTVSKLAIAVSTAAVTPTASENFLGLVDSTGTVQASTPAGQLDSQMGASGLAWSNVAFPYAAPPGRYWVVVLVNCATPPVLATLSSITGATNLVQAGASAALYWGATNLSGRTTLPASFTMSSNAAAMPFVVAVG